MLFLGCANSEQFFAIIVSFRCWVVLVFHFGTITALFFKIIKKTNIGFYSLPQYLLQNRFSEKKLFATVIVQQCCSMFASRFF